MTEIVDHTLRQSWTPAAGSAVHLPETAVRFLADRVGELGPDAPITPDSAVPESPSTLESADLAALSEVVGEKNVRTGHGDRLGRSGGMSYLDLLRHRSLGELAVPDGVVLPADPDEVNRILQVAVKHDIGVVPFGGGTSVVGGVNALRGNKKSVIALDLSRLDQLVSVDPISRTAVLQAGLTGPAADKLLEAHGFTIGHVPQSYERATIGGYAATRSAGQASSGYGRFEDMVAGVRVATAKGEWRLGVAPASAAGPDLKQLVVGSEGTLGVITEVTVRVRPVPKVEKYEGVFVDGWERGATVIRELAQDGLLADITRLSDPAESSFGVNLFGGKKGTGLHKYLSLRGIKDPCMIVLGWHGASGKQISARRKETVRRLRKAGAVGVPTVGETWRKGRFAGARQRDAFLDIGVAVETLETATFWSNLNRLRDAVREALSTALAKGDKEPIVLCHISHAYETGASLYFTVLGARDGEDPVDQWQRAKAAACAAISGGGSGRSLGTISHHHAVGADHAPYLATEIGDLGVDVLIAAKDTLDPTGILNPGKLIRGKN